MTITPSTLSKSDVLSKVEAGESFNVRLRFANTHDYLYAVECDYSEDERRRRVLTFPLDNEIQKNTALDWLLEPVQQPGQQDENATAVIRLSSVKYPGEYLLAGTDDLTLDMNRRKVYTWKEKGTDFSQWGGPDQWILLDSATRAADDRSKSNYLALRNKKFDEDLYASSDRFELDHKFGTVYTWRQDSEIRDSASGTETQTNAWEILVISQKDQSA
ncbi:hypothetical protein DAPPUDRAFT_300316 [Daphnia pulex]|uniref:Uncharacterized protein n=1 Tax=Daphnia pulex TaxID=6669 RepID=E9G505_DAPPU|nr:hypothetical protein DAPPUDRAFT_300316 [Daphnia pulex]|eukprot:EFX85465.1 hypothetical protein DAPPUDRAFT_300316 [Daphnia pulex]